MAITTDELPPVKETSHAGLPRQAVESAICLVVAVLIFRTFAAEGYMISTGSMAPHLLGFHKQVACPSCGHLFAVGVAFDQSVSPTASEFADIDGELSGQRTICPNCTQSSIDISLVPRNHGDQLLVHKHGFQFHTPRRWETAVFRNPARPREAYVKRIVGLPGESLRIVRGDVFIDGVRARKTYDMQRAMRIAVHDHSEQPEPSNDWRPRWAPRGTFSQLSASPDSRWQPFGEAFVHPLPDTVSVEETLDWVDYHHWIRAGGLHETSVPLVDWPDDVDLGDYPFIRLRFDARAQTISCTGAMPLKWRDQLTAVSGDESFRRAIRDLYERSHVAPIVDEYSYNSISPGRAPIPVRDVMLEMTMHWEGGAGEFVVALKDDLGEYRCRFDFARDVVELFIGDDDKPVRTAPIPLLIREEPALLEMSNFDRQILVAINGKPPFPAFTYEPPRDGDAEIEPKDVPREQVAAFAARRIEVAVAGLKLYRDIHYTSRASRNGIFEPYSIRPGEYFVLGDNSPVSHDSRRWTSAGVPQRYLLGKPFLVHLPSKPGKIRIGHREAYIRIPDFTRVRYIR